MARLIALAPTRRSIEWPAVWQWLRPISGATQDILALDGLRGLAVLLVMVVHVFIYLRAVLSPTGYAVVGVTEFVWGFGATGVELFFVLSGFLLFMPYARALLGQKPFPSTRKFYTRRVLRIVPAYWVALAVFVLASIQTALPALRPESHLSWQNIVLHLLFLHNVDGQIDSSMNGVFWSMAVEAQFYLLLPLAAALAYRLVRAGRLRTLWIAIGAALLISPACQICYLIVQQTSSPFGAHEGILGVFEYSIVFLAGMLASTAYVAVTEAHWKVAWLRLGDASSVRRLSLAGAAAIVAYIVIIRLLGHDRMSIASGQSLLYAFLAYPLLAVAYTALLLAALCGKSWWQRILSSAPARFVGLISYSLYIWHWPIYQHVILRLAGRMHGDVLKTLVFVALVFLVVLPVSYLSYQFVERPFIRFRLAQHDTSLAAPAPAPLAVALEPVT